MYVFLLVFITFLVVVFGTYIVLWYLHEKLFYYDSENPEWRPKGEFKDAYVPGNLSWKKYIDNMVSTTKWTDKIYINRYLEDLGVPGPDVVFMGYKDNGLKGLSEALKNIHSYCLKPSFLCESIGIMLVKDGKLQLDIKIPKSVKKTLKYRGPSKKGEGVDIENIVDFVQCLYKIPEIEPNRMKICHPKKLTSHGKWKPWGWCDVGVVVEQVFPPSYHVKIFVAAGEVTVLYSQKPTFTVNGKTQFDRTMENRISEIRSICHEISNSMGIPIFRLDLVVPKSKMFKVRVNEITVDPTVSFYLGFGMYFDIKKIMRFVRDKYKKNENYGI